jgi:hypothetical protein
MSHKFFSNSSLQILTFMARRGLRIWRLEPNRPKIVCLCGSTRFWREFQKQGLEETLDGNIVLSIGAASGTDDEHFGNLSTQDYDNIKEQLDVLHLQKIDLADEVLVLNVGGYIGDSTRREVLHAHTQGKPIRWLEQPPSLELPVSKDSWPV